MKKLSRPYAASAWVLISAASIWPQSQLLTSPTNLAQTAVIATASTMASALQAMAALEKFPGR